MDLKAARKFNESVPLKLLNARGRPRHWSCSALDQMRHTATWQQLLCFRTIALQPLAAFRAAALLWPQRTDFIT
jgi:hypothetical protein